MITPQNQANKLASAIGLQTPLYLKREDLHPSGSHKGRSIPLMIEHYTRQGARDFVISSSGNAALAAAKFVIEHNRADSRFRGNDKLKLSIFVGKKIDDVKLKGILRFAQDDNRKRVMIRQVANPKQAAFQMDKLGRVKNLRQSTDDIALLGYEELAKELAEIKNLSAVFIPTSSGTTAQGLYEGFKKLKINPQIHIVQTDACHPMINTPLSPLLGGNNKIPPKKEGEGGVSLASAIVDKVAHRKNKILKILKNSHGAGWIAANSEIKKAIENLKQTEKVEISPNSALSVVGLMQAIKSGQKFNGPVVCIFTGR